MTKKLIIVGGATATGKTAEAIRMAQQLGTEIISADSRQFYRGLDIGTAKPTREELAAAKHHLIDSLDVEQPYSVGEFERDALHLLDDIFSRHDHAIMVCGSGLFLKAVCQGLDVFPTISDNSKQTVVDIEQKGGILLLQYELKRLDPEQFQRIDPQNPARLRRALEVCLESGAPYSSFLAKDKIQRPFQSIYHVMDMPRDLLYARINARVDAMIAAGLEAEARRFLPFRHYPALNTIGYTEWFEYFDGMLTRPEAIDKIKQHSRNYAKRQVTWFRKYGNAD